MLAEWAVLNCRDHCAIIIMNTNLLECWCGACTLVFMPAINFAAIKGTNAHVYNVHTMNKSQMTICHAIAIVSIYLLYISAQVHLVYHVYKIHKSMPNL